MNQKTLGRSFVSIGTLLLLCFAAVQKIPVVAPFPTLCPRCNVIIIMIDTLRADALPCYGYALATAPNLCAFAKQNILFTQAFASSSWTLPSEVSLLTGLYPTSHNVGRAIQDVLNPEVDTLPQVFKQNGYQTTAITNVQINVGLEQGLGRGFDTIKITPNTPQGAIEALATAIEDMNNANRRRTPAFIFFHTDNIQKYLNMLPQSPDTFPLDPDYYPPRIPKDAYTFTHRTWNILRDELLYLTNTDNAGTHVNLYTPLYKKITHAKTLEDAYKTFTELPKQKQNEILWQSGSETVQAYLGDQYIPFVRHFYDASILKFDAYLPEIFTRLSKHNLDRNTIVLISSEHGELIGEHGLVGHFQKLYEPEIRVPLIMRVPRIAKKRIDDLVSHVDIYRTLLDLTGIRHESPTSSVSYVDAIRSSRKSTRTAVISEGATGGVIKSMLTDRWHLLEIAREIETTYELYDRIRDPKQTHNVATSEQQTVMSLTKELHTTLNTQPDYPSRSELLPEWINEEHRKKLIETGYY